MAKEACSAEELRYAFEQSVARHLVGDAPVGVFLSGGIDSSAITMAASRVSSGPVKTVSIVCPEHPHLSEQTHARQIAERAGSDHSEVPFSTRDQIESIPRALAAMDQPTVDGINTYVVSAAARQAGWKAALSGLGGDELFGGYRSSFVDTFRRRLWSRRLGPFRWAASAVLNRLDTFATKPSKLADLFSSPGDLISAYMVGRKLFTSPQIRAMFPGLIGAGWCDGLPSGQLSSLHRQLRHRAETDAIGLLEMQRYMGQQLLRDSDVMGMAHGLEIRMPFLDAAFSRSALMLEASVRIPTAMPKHHLVECLGDWLPRDSARRPKQGFLLPIRHSMLGPLRDRVWEGLQGLSRFGDAAHLGAIRRQWEGFCRHPDRLGWARPWSLFVLADYLQRLDLRVEQ